ncbi:MAG TPA: YqeG family HAD IIIA-type phosphatase [Ruminococcaceae bacterium]|nr:YqeG family HAD IIIA-type phosphatase [Oscillospiraceae bacterium]HCM23309.1 YqeG family HAD IIIA-type phosphatase [Oscillospiraceae bacterium]
MTLNMPSYSVDWVTQITPPMLHRMHVKAILLDVDNTLSPPDSQIPFSGTIQWVQKMQNNGFKLIILSNNFKWRVAPFAAQYGLPYVSFALKPLPVGYLRAMSKLHVRRSETVAIGDQIFTDILGANLVGLQSILVTPRITEGSASFLRRRHWEQSIRQELKNTGRHISPKE